MFYQYTQEELRAFCRKNIENFEIWARNIIHEKMIANYGSDYINYKVSDENFLIKREIREHVLKMLKKDISRYPRIVDTLFVDHIIYFFCHDKFYSTLFKEALGEIYPDGREEIRTLLSRLIPIRNALSHSNPISIHQAERAICYTHDFIEGIKSYYKKKGEEKMWNVPSIIKIKDSLGNIFTTFQDNATCVVYVPQTMNVGDSYSLEIEIDPTFNDEDYNITWEYNHKKNIELNNKTKFNITFAISDVAKEYPIICTITQNKEWHKYYLWDFRVLICLTVLPPKN